MDKGNSIVDAPRCIFCYHKSGTILLRKVFSELCRENEWVFEILMGEHNQIPNKVEFILFGHSPAGILTQSTNFLGVHVIRDPRDIVVSGYLYHLRTREAWCIYNDFNLSPPIDFPNVPFSQRHGSHEWKKNYILSLQGLSYQERLRSLSQEDGIVFEMRHYAKWTIESMMDWDFGRSNILEVRFEEIMEAFDSTFERIFRFLRLTANQLDIAMQIIQRHNIQNKTARELSTLEHVYSKQTNRWKKYFSAEHKKLFVELFDDCLIQLGYENSNDW